MLLLIQEQKGKSLAESVGEYYISLTSQNHLMEHSNPWGPRYFPMWMLSRRWKTQEERRYYLESVKGLMILRLP